MLTYLLYLIAALYLGILTSISPCPLATNIAAISYIGSKVENGRLVIHAGLLYTLGRCVLYISLAGLLTLTSLSIPAVSLFLQKYMHLILGPIFLILGMFLAGLVSVTFGGGMMNEKLQKRVDSMGIWGALLLGILFAVSFCPTSATWFFGLLALTLGADSGAITSVLSRIGLTLPSASVPGGSFVLPLVYGIGTALPVLVVAFLLAYSAKSLGQTFKVLTQIEWWARMTTGWVFILLGVYFSLSYVFEVSFTFA
ncbi:Cytochrome C biogenesis protein transmembrane region [Novipirellula artificiosorum]|uniref:Cytochrome C biogenesis protein transmembrane region n=2 Tax=Novipirellula artificiosorum TaxID=2528016 RepID=A0A5C6DPP9_9BACT|nr:Cytochrome C biogenesis protein transmembrane region [Novipirellula artificiosorum]